MKAPAIFQSANQNILRYADFSSDVVPLNSSYPVEILAALRPDMRLRFGTDTVTLTANLAAVSPSLGPALGDVLVIPACNLQGSVLTLTNDQGLNEAIPIPAPLDNGIPRTIVVDLESLEPNPAIRTASVWNLVIVGNFTDVIMGGAWAIYGPKTYLIDRDFQWGYTVRLTGGVIETKNEYLTLFQQSTLTLEREIELSTLATTADADDLQAWFEGSLGRGLRGLLWFNPDIEDAHLGIWQPTFERTLVFTDVEQIRVVFTEVSKGLPLL